MKLLKNKVFALFAAAVLAVSGVAGLVSCAPTTTSTAEEKPGAVKSLRAKAKDSEVTLTWTNPRAKGFTGTKVYVGDEEKAALGKTESTYKITGLTNGTEYTFKVTAFFEGVEESFSATVKAIPKDASKLSSVEFAENLVIGWNLGNTLDATATWTSDTETAWGMPRTTKDMIVGVHAAGFETIRIPVSWHNHVSGTDNKIDSAWMSRVKTVVDWAIDDGMYVIINIHHDNLIAKATSNQEGIDKSAGFCLSSDSEIQTKSTKYIKDVWTQIAKTFADYDEHLIFEVLNEPRDVGGQYEWYMPDATTSKKWNAIVTKYEQAGLAAIRAVSGNENRFVMCPPYAASGSNPTILSNYTLPVDSANDKLLLSTHAYSPNDFALNGDMTKTKFLDSYKSDLDFLFSNLKKNYVDKGIGVVMGEASATDKNNTAERIKWAEYYFGKAKAASIPVVLWDNMVPYPNGNDGAERHGHFNRKTLEWYHPDLVEAMVKAAGGSAVTAVTLFDVATFEAPEGMGIVTVNDKKYLKMTINGYNTNFKIPAVDCNGATTFKVECFAEVPNSEYQVTVGIKDGTWKNISLPVMKPLTDSPTEITGTLTTGTEDSSTTRITGIIQPMAQNSEYKEVNDIVFFISKITAE